MASRAWRGGRGRPIEVWPDRGHCGRWGGAGRLSYGAIAFIASDVEDARRAQAELAARYDGAAPEAADVIVALGGDGFMLQTLHAFMNTGKPIYGMHCGSVGFLMNDFSADALPERVQAAVET